MIKPISSKILNEGLNKGEIFLDVDYGDFSIYHDVVEDVYYVKDLDGSKENLLKPLTLVTEVRYNMDVSPSDDELLDGMGKAQELGFDYSGEFDVPIETAEGYVFRYGYFKEITKQQPNMVTELIIYKEEK